MESYIKTEKKSAKKQGYKTLCACAMATVLTFNIPVQAQENAVPLPKSEDKSYTLIKVDAPGENVITKYEWSNTENKYVPVYYRVDLSKTEYGYPDIKDETKTFTITTPNSDGTSSAFKYDIKYYVDNSRKSADRITEDQQGADINKDFIGLKNESATSSVFGGALYNAKITGDISADFISNSAQAYTGSSKGGAIFNYSSSWGNKATLGNINGTFLGNYAESSSSGSLGGAIYNSGLIGDISGVFIGNYVKGSYAEGGAIYSGIFGTGGSTIGNINADFIGNYVITTGDSYSIARGGAIYGEASVFGDITGDFIGNYVQGVSYTQGGAIYNSAYEGSASPSGKIGNIKGNFIGNYVNSNNDESSGGAIFNKYSSIESITGDFIENYAQGVSALGGAIFNVGGTIGTISGEFIGNYAQGTTAQGGAIFNYGTLSGFNANFIENHSKGVSSSGGAIYNSGIIENFTGNFISNYAYGSDIAMGGAVFNTNKIISYDVPSDKVINISQYAMKVKNPNTGESYVIYNVKDITPQKINELLTQGYKFICNPIDMSSQILPEEWEEFEKYIQEGIANGEMTLDKPFDDSALAIEKGGIVNSSFINNYAESQNGKALGGAIFSTNKIMITADNGQSVFSGNKTISNGVTEQNAIAMYGLAQKNPTTGEIVFVDMLTGQPTSKNQNNGVILFDDTIRGGAIDYEKFENGEIETIETQETAFDLKITGDSTGKVILNNDVINANISLDNTNLYLGRDNVFDQSQSLTLNSGSMSMINNQAGTMNIPTLNLNGTTNLNKLQRCRRSKTKRKQYKSS